MNKTYKEIYKEEQQIEQGLASYWGYQVRRNTTDRKNRRDGDGAVPILANITLRKFGKEIEKTDKMIKIEEQLKALENERQLMRMTQKAASGENDGQEEDGRKSPIIQMMEGKIQQYNYIVNHKHLNNRESDQTRKILKMEAKSEMEKVLQKIRGAREKLVSGNMKDQIALNREMAKLYRTYRQKMDGRSTSTNDYFRSRTMVPQPAKSNRSAAKKEYFLKIQSNTKYTIRKELSYVNNTKSDRNLLREDEEDNSNHYTEGNAKTHFGLERLNIDKRQTRQRKYSKYVGNLTDRPSTKGFRETFLTDAKTKIEKEVIEPYLEKKDVLKYREMQNKIKSNSEALEVIKTKVNDARNSSKVFKVMMRRQLIKTYGQTDNLPIRQSLFNSTIVQPEISDLVKKQVYKTIAEKNKKQERQKQDILAGILKKKHNKFNKIGGGNKMMIKYDEHREARELLKGEGNKSKLKNMTITSNDQKEESVMMNSVIDRSKISSLKASPKIQIPDVLSYLKDENDDQHYQRMCKNQKINLLFKKR